MLVLIGHIVYLRMYTKFMSYNYDPPRLLKNIRNNLKSNGFLVRQEEIRWEHVVNKNPIRLAKKLTARHINLHCT